VGALNGLILPIALAVMLIIIQRKKIVGYQHAKWLSICGWLVVTVMTYMSFLTIKDWLN